MAEPKEKGQPVKVGLDSLGTRMDAGFPLMVPGAGLEPARLAAGDFESPESTNFTTRAVICEGCDYRQNLAQFEAHFRPMNSKGGPPVVGLGCTERRSCVCLAPRMGALMAKYAHDLSHH